MVCTLYFLVFNGLTGAMLDVLKGQEAVPSSTNCALMKFSGQMSLVNFERPKGGQKVVRAVRNTYRSGRRVEVQSPHLKSGSSV